MYKWGGQPVDAVSKSIFQIEIVFGDFPGDWWPDGPNPRLYKNESLLGFNVIWLSGLPMGKPLSQSE